MNLTKHLLVAAFFLGSSMLHAAEPDPKTAGQEIAATIKAIYKPDYGLLLKHTHDAVLELAGGKKAFKKTLVQTHGYLASKNVSVETVEVGVKLDYFETEKNEFFFIATRITLKVGDKTHVAPGHQMGVKKKSDKVWKYIDCSALDDEQVRKMFPDFPEDKKLPNGK